MMQWMILLLSLMLLFLLTQKTRRPYESLLPNGKDARSVRLSEEAQAAHGRGFLRFRVPHGLLRSMEKPLAFLLLLPEDERLPAAGTLCANARMLQEEAACVIRAVKSLPKLPCTPHKETRIRHFACSLLGACSLRLTKDHLTQGVEAWQSVLPMTEAELHAMPLVIKTALLEQLCILSRRCEETQRSRQAALRVHTLCRHHRIRQAKKLFSAHAADPAFLERILTLGAGGEWLDEALEAKEWTADEITMQEQERQTLLAGRIDAVIDSLHLLRRLPWQRLAEEWSHVHAILKEDPVYTQMDEESRRFYRRRTAQIARLAHLGEKSTAEGVMHLCQQAADEPLASHTGYYLLDNGYEQLMHHLHMNGFAAHMRFFLRTRSLGVFRLLSWLCFAFFLLAAWKLDIAPLLWLPFALWCVFCMQQLGMLVFRRSQKSRILPRMRVERLQKDEAVLVVCPVVLTSASQAVQAVKKLAVLHEAEPDAHLHFLLLGDFQDSLSAAMTTDAEILSAAASAVRALCEETGHPFFYLQRERTYTTGEACHHPRERRRGAVQMALRLTQGLPVQDSFVYATFDPDVLKGQYRFVITLDSDARPSPGSLLRMVGAMLHPLARRCKADHRTRGVSVIYPRKEASIGTMQTPFGEPMGASRSAEAVYAGASFDGNGIIDPASFLEATAGIPDGVVLDHALIEGELAGCAVMEDTLLYTDSPQTLRAYLAAQSLHTRAVWQMLCFLLPFGPAAYRLKKHRLIVSSRFALWRMMLKSLAPLFRLLLLGYACADGRAWLWLSALLAADLPHLFSSSGLKGSLLRLCILPCEAFVQMRAIGRALYRLFFSHHHLLLTSDEKPSRFGAVPSMLFFSLNMGCAALFALFWLLKGADRALSLICASVWAIFAIVQPFGDQERSADDRPTRYMHEVLMRLAGQTLAYFENATSSSVLPAAHIQLEPDKGPSPYTTPSAIGLYLCALVSAQQLGLLEAREMQKRITAAADAMEQLPKWHGLPYSRYTVRTHTVFGQALVSSEECGVWGVALLTCAQGIRSLLPELDGDAAALAQRLDDLVLKMDLSFLYDPEAELFWTEMDAATHTPAETHHAFLCSEAQLLSLLAIMLHQAPVRHWYRLSRSKACGQALLSQNGSMSAVMLPLLFLPPVPGTLLSASAGASLRLQRAHRYKGAFGASSAACCMMDADLNYLSFPFGIEALALKSDTDSHVIAPYATLLAAAVDLKAAFSNISRLQLLGLDGPWGFFEAADFDDVRTQGKGMRIVRMHTSAHQGMILCAVCNALKDRCLAKQFTSLTRFQAFELLLEEAPLRQRSLIRRPFRQSGTHTPSEAQGISRQARPLHFPIDAHLYSGGGTCWLIDAQGGGALRHNGTDVTHFEPNCRFPSGMRIYLRDSQSGVFWTATDPYLMHSVRFESAQAVFTHARFGVECELRMWVDALDGSAVHCLTLTNRTDDERLLEVCSYLETGLKEDVPVRVQRLGKSGLCAVFPSDGGERRLIHLLRTEAALAAVRLQGDRAAFLGRGRSFHAPRALEHDISALADTTGVFQDRCMSVRGQFALPARRKACFFFVTRLMEEESADAFCKRCDSTEDLLLSYEAAVTRAGISARQQNLSQGEQTILSRMTGALLYTGQPWQGAHAPCFSTPSADFVSADKPFVLLECSGSINRTLLSLLIRGSRWFALGGFPFDLLVILQGRRKLPSLLAQAEELMKEHCASADESIRLFAQPDMQTLQALRSSARLVLRSTSPVEEQLNALIKNVYARPIYVPQPASGWKAVLPAEKDVIACNGFGGFLPEDGRYRLFLKPGMQTPVPWRNVLHSPFISTLADESGLKCSTDQRICTAADTGVFKADEAFFLRDEEHHLLWSLTRRPLGHGMPVRITQGFGEVLYESSAYGICTRLHCFGDPEEPLGIRMVQIRNEDRLPRTLMLSHCASFAAILSCEGDRITGWDPQLQKATGLCAADPAQCICAAMSDGAFQGLWHNAPYALSCLNRSEGGSGSTAILTFALHLEPGESCTITTAVCLTQTPQELENALLTLRTQGGSERLHLMRQQWTQRLDVLQFDLPHPALAFFLGRWLPCQLWTDPDDDPLYAPWALIESHPEQMRSRLLGCTHQTLFFIFALADYVRISGDSSILQEEALIEKCLKAIDEIRYGAHDLPVEHGMESVLAGMFLCEVLRRFAPLCISEDKNRLLLRRSALLSALDRFAWDGAWYLQGWDAEGKMLGSIQDGHTADIAVQCWAVLCGLSPKRCADAMEHVWRLLKTDPFPPCVLSSCWAVSALHQLGEEERAWEMALRLLPAVRCATPQTAARCQHAPYRMEGGAQCAGWYLSVMLRELLGFHKSGDRLCFQPILPAQWDAMRITFRCGSATYHLHASRTQQTPAADGLPLQDGWLALCDDGRIHEAFFPLR